MTDEKQGGHSRWDVLLCAIASPTAQIAGSVAKRGSLPGR